MARIYVLSGTGEYNFPETPREFMEFWQDVFSKIPQEYMDSARLEFLVDEFYEEGAYSLHYEVYYDKPEES